MNREVLLAELAAHAPADEREAESLEWMRRFVAGPADPLARDNPVGHITASAVIARENEVLLVYHRKLSRWLQPGGHVEHSDASAFEAAVREASEESGIRPDAFASPLGARILDVDVHLIPARKTEPAHHHFDVRFLLTTASDIDRAATDNPTRPIEWRSWDDAMSSGVDESLARALTKARQRLG